jgi:hypothetical protein
MLPGVADRRRQVARWLVFVGAESSAGCHLSDYDPAGAGHGFLIDGPGTLWVYRYSVVPSVLPAPLHGSHQRS